MKLVFRAGRGSWGRTQKLDRTGQSSAQYAGSLFEQLVVLLGDALFDVLWRRSGKSADELWPRHANIE